MEDPYELTILMPCLNEAETLASCIDKARGYLERSGVDGEIVVADNGSTDGSQALASAHGARVVDIAERGYGCALRGGIAAARGTYVIMGDSDCSYDFSALEPFVAKLREGYALVMGNRFRGGIEKGAMPLLHRYLGNPVLSALGRTFFGSSCGDFYCGLRGFRRDAIMALDIQSPGMAFALEMVVRAINTQLPVTEVPTTLSPDGRSRPPHLRTWRDGWRSLRFFLLFSPRWLFLNPGFALLLTGLMGMLWLLPEPRPVGRVTFDIHTLFYASLAVVIGAQSVLFGVFVKIYGEREGIVPPDPWFRTLCGAFSLELGLVVGAALILSGIGLAGYALSFWSAENFGTLVPAAAMRLVIPSGTLVLLGFQVAFAAFFTSILEIRATRPSIPAPSPLPHAPAQAA